MMGFQENFCLGKVVLPNNVFYAPLAGCSDYPFRRMAARFKPGLMFCEMVKMEALIRRDSTTLRYLDYHSSMRPIGAQICGSNPKIAAEAAKIVEDLGFDVIDLNCGCPVDKVVKDGSGSALLLHPEKIAEILCAIKSAVSIPVTAKVRIGWDKNTIPIYEVLSYVEQSGASLLTIHGRTREQGYSGLANWEYIRECKKRAKIPIFGNGDVFDHLAAKKMFDETACDGVMVARGMLGKPWLAEDIFHFFQEKEPHKRSYVEQLDMLLVHYDCISEYQKNPVYALYDMRRVGCWYLKSFPGMKVLRVAINEAKTSEEAYQIVYQARRDALRELPSPEATCGYLDNFPNLSI